MNSSKPKISIIIPVYNTAEYITRSVSSVIQQTYTNTEIIIVNDGSSDDSLAICMTLADKDDRVVVVNQSNLGVSAARNAGIGAASGDFIAFIDSDDTVSRHMLDLLYDSIRANNADVSMCKMRKLEPVLKWREVASVNKTELLTGKEALLRLLYEKSITNSVCSKLYKSSLIKKNKFNTSITIGEDFDTNYRVLKYARRVVTNSSSHYNYFQRSGSAMNSSFSKKNMGILYSLENILKEVQIDSHDLVNPVICKLFLQATTLYRYSRGLDSDSAKYSDLCKDKLKLYAKDVLLNGSAKSSSRLYALLALINPILLDKSLKIKERISVLVKL